MATKTPIVLGTNVHGPIGSSDTLTVDSIPLSSDSGNLIEARDDGLYYGEVAPANLSTLYIDAENGVDQDPDVVSGAGTKDNPLKSIRYALTNLGSDGLTRTLRLHDSQTHEITVVQGGNGAVNVRGGSVTIYPYGDNYDSANAAAGYDVPETYVNMLADGTDAKIQFYGTKENEYPSQAPTHITPDHVCMYLVSGASLVLKNVTILNRLDNIYSKSGGDLPYYNGASARIRAYNSIKGTVVFQGVQIQEQGTITYPTGYEDAGGKHLGMFDGSNVGIAVQYDKTNPWGECETTKVITRTSANTLGLTPDTTLQIPNDDWYAKVVSLCVQKVMDGDIIKMPLTNIPSSYWTA